MTTKKRAAINFNINVNFNLRTTTPKNKLTTVRPIVRYNNERVVLPSDFSIKPQDWNVEKQKAKGTIMYDDDTTINEHIENRIAKIKAVFKAYTDKHSKFPEPDIFKALVVSELNKTDEVTEEPAIKDLIAFTEQFIHESVTGLRISHRGAPISPNSIKIYNTFKKNIENFRDGKLPGADADGKVKKYQDGKRHDVSLENIGRDFFEDFKEYMTFGLEYNTNTVAKHIRTLKTITNEARERSLTSAAFTGKHYRAITEEVDSIYLNEDELGVLYDIDLRPSLDRVRDLFLVGCWTGLRFSDFTNIRRNNIIENTKGKFIQIQMQKTGNSVAVPILPVVETIMEKYHGKTSDGLLPDDITNQKMNLYLKEIGEIAANDNRVLERYPRAAFNELIEQQETKAGKKVITHTVKHKLITCHTARRSFATNAYHLKIPAVTIMSITGHKTESEFLKYIKVTPVEHAEIVMDAFRRAGLRVVNY